MGDTQAEEDAWKKKFALIGGAIVLLPMLFLRTVNEIAPVSFLGLCASIIVVLVVTIGGLVDQHDRHITELTSTKPLDVTNFPSAFAAITVSFGGHA